MFHRTVLLALFVVISIDLAEQYSKDDCQPEWVPPYKGCEIGPQVYFYDTGVLDCVVTPYGVCSAPSDPSVRFYTYEECVKIAGKVCGMYYELDAKGRLPDKYYKYQKTKA